MGHSAAKRRQLSARKRGAAALRKMIQDIVRNCSLMRHPVAVLLSAAAPAKSCVNNNFFILFSAEFSSDSCQEGMKYGIL